MPYKTKSDLPESVKHVLPSHAQDIYKEAFNSAWDQYKDKDDRRDVAGALSLVALVAGKRKPPHVER